MEGFCKKIAYGPLCETTPSVVSSIDTTRNRVRGKHTISIHEKSIIIS